MKIIPGELKFGSHLNVIRAVTLRSEHFALKENIICAVTLPSEYFAFYLCSHFAFLFSTKAVIPSFLSFVPNDAWKIKKSEIFPSSVLSHMHLEHPLLKPEPLPESELCGSVGWFLGNRHGNLGQ